MKKLKRKITHDFIILRNALCNELKLEDDNFFMILFLDMLKKIVLHMSKYEKIYIQVVLIEDCNNRGVSDFLKILPFGKTSKLQFSRNFFRLLKNEAYENKSKFIVFFDYITKYFKIDIDKKLKCKLFKIFLNIIAYSSIYYAFCHEIAHASKNSIENISFDENDLEESFCDMVSGKTAINISEIISVQLKTVQNFCPAAIDNISILLALFSCLFFSFFSNKYSINSQYDSIYPNKQDRSVLNALGAIGTISHFKNIDHKILISYLFDLHSFLYDVSPEQSKKICIEAYKYFEKHEKMTKKVTMN